MIENWYPVLVGLPILCLFLTSMTFIHGRRIRMIENRLQSNREEMNSVHVKIDSYKELTVAAFEVAMARALRPLQDGLDETRKEVRELSSLITTYIEKPTTNESSSGSA